MPWKRRSTATTTFAVCAARCFDEMLRADKTPSLRLFRLCRAYVFEQNYRADLGLRLLGHLTRRKVMGPSAANTTPSNKWGRVQRVLQEAGGHVC